MALQSQNKRRRCSLQSTSQAGIKNTSYPVAIVKEKSSTKTKAPKRRKGKKERGREKINVTKPDQKATSFFLHANFDSVFCMHGTKLLTKPQATSVCKSHGDKIEDLEMFFGEEA